MGDASRDRIAGLKDWSIEITFKQDYAASKVDATLFSLVGAAEFAIAVRKSDTDATAATNPEYQGNCVLESYQPFGQTVGELAVAPITVQGAGDLTRATS